MTTPEDLADCEHLEVVQHGWKWKVVCDERTERERERDKANFVMPDSPECRKMRKVLTRYGYQLFCDAEE